MNDNESIKCLIHLVPWLLPTKCASIWQERTRERERGKKINNLLSFSFFFYIQMKDMKLSLKEFLSFFFLFLWFSIFSLTWMKWSRRRKRKRDANRFRLFVLSFSHVMIPPEWMNEWIACIASAITAAAVFLFSFLNQNKRIQHRCRSSCLISRRWLSMLWACHLIHKSSNCR
jgi:hypothetical protein